MSASRRNGPLRVGLVGIGQRAYIGTHVGSAATPAELVAVADHAEEGRARAQGFFGPDVPVHTSVEEMIAAADLDAAIVTTPDFTHAAVATTLLEAGIAVYLEKPMAITVEDCDALLATAERTGSALYVGHNYRHASVVRQLKKVIDDGLIGEVKSVWCRHFVGNGGDYYFKDWHADRSKVTSLLLQKASHDLDVIHFLTGRWTRRVTAMGALTLYGDITDRRDRSGETVEDWLSLENWPPREQTGLNPVVDVEDLSMMLMDLGDGLLASYEQCHYTPDYWRSYTIIGDAGRVENFGDSAGGTIRVWNTRRIYSADGDVEIPIEGEGEGHADADVLTVVEFLAHVADGAPTTVSPHAARQAVATGVAATRSLRNGSQPFDVTPLPPALAAPTRP